MDNQAHTTRPARATLIDRIIRFCLENKLVVLLLTLFFIGWGILVAPFDWEIMGLPRNPVPVDAIPDIGENQQIVFTEWEGRSPQDVDDQITYPLTTALLGIPGVKTVRSYSMFGFSTIYIIFTDDIDFYWSRSRVLEKLSSLPAGTLPEGVSPALGPDATALGQVFWYTLEGQDEKGNPTGGWDLHELRSIQDWHVRYALLSAEGVSEVASVGGFVKEYQIDADPDAMRAYRVSIDEIVGAVRMSNIDVGARTIEVNKVEYVIRGLGFIKNLNDIERAVIKVNDNVPVYVGDVARVSLGPALRRGALDKEGAEVAGGVVVVRYGGNPLAAIKNVKQKIEEIAPGMPQKVLPDGTVSQVTVVPFYDRTGLIYETLDTLNKALIDEILVTIIVVIFMLMHLRSSLLISGVLPLAVLICFIAMKTFGVDANIVALSGIAIAIGTIVDMGIIVCENIIRHLDAADPGEDRLEVLFRACSEVGSAVLTAIATTIVSFLPVFAMEAAEGKLFRPLAFTKTFALFASVLVALTLVPSFAHILLAGRMRGVQLRRIANGVLVVTGLTIAVLSTWWIGAIIVLIGLYYLFEGMVPEGVKGWIPWAANGLALLTVVILLSGHWLPLGPEKGLVRNLAFAIAIIGGMLFFFQVFTRLYGDILRWCLDHKIAFLTLPLITVFLGLNVWLGFDFFFGWLPRPVKTWAPVSALVHTFPGLGKEFMPPLDEGSYLFMPTTMPHASIGEVLDVLQKQDMAIGGLPEVESVVGKLGRAESALDPAPIEMIETVINYKPEFLIDRGGRRLTFRFDPDDTDFFRNESGEPVPAPDGKPYRVQGRFERDEHNRLIPDSDGNPFRLWRPPLDPDFNDDRRAWGGIKKPDDIWDAIVTAAEIPGTTSAPRLQPIAARIVMLQSGMRAPMGVKVKGPNLEAIQQVAFQIERFLKEVPLIEPATVIADRIIGKPYLEIEIDRTAIARYGVMLSQVQEVIEVAIGGKPITTTVEGRERYPVRVRYLRELRDSIEELGRILVPTPDGSQIPLTQLAEITYKRGPDMIKSEDTFLVGYVLFDKKPDYAEVAVVEQAREYLQHKIKSGDFQVPGGVSFSFAGSYENQVRAQKRLMVVLPLALFIIFMIIYFQFKTIPVTTLVFLQIGICWAGGFIMIWLYAQPWFLNFSVFGSDLRELFQIHPVNLSVAVWVGFLALFGIATDDAVIMSTYLNQAFEKKCPSSVRAIREATVEAGKRRVRPCLMTTATTMLALIPVLTSTGRGSDIMIPMAIPSFGGMVFNVMTILVTPVLYCALKEFALKAKQERG